MLGEKATLQIGTATYGRPMSDGLTVHVWPIAPVELFGAVPLLPVQLFRQGEAMLLSGLICAHQGRRSHTSSEQHRRALQQNRCGLPGLLDLMSEGDSCWRLSWWHSHSTDANAQIDSTASISSCTYCPRGVDDSGSMAGGTRARSRWL